MLNVSATWPWPGKAASPWMRSGTPRRRSASPNSSCLARTRPSTTGPTLSRWLGFGVKQVAEDAEFLLARPVRPGPPRLDVLAQPAADRDVLQVRKLEADRPAVGLAEDFLQLPQRDGAEAVKGACVELLVEVGFR